ncbi:unnamed protein product [Paramecium sonneborni]|uniref:Uncharacterized protein n=1 Tax=Paramecium sonneborni TaxID=65129 RepID=A0A8S1QTL2_9CILI|nr:unnamed protein product [Paramecium sonneborni]
MRLDHDKNVKAVEGRLLIEEKARYNHQIELLKKKEMKAQQTLKQFLQFNILSRAENESQAIKDDIQLIEEQIQQEREKVHQTHLQISKRSIKQEKMINNNNVLDHHIDNLIKKQMKHFSSQIFKKIEEQMISNKGGQYKKDNMLYIRLICNYSIREPQNKKDS